MSFLALAKQRLYERELPLVDTPAQDTLAQKFAAYDKANPDVGEAFDRCAMSHVRDGYISPRDLAPEVRRIVRHGTNNSF